MRTLLAVLLITLNMGYAYAQNDLKARINFENAEEAYNNKEYSNALRYITEAEKLLNVWTPKVSYLKIRILADDPKNKIDPDTVELPVIKDIEREVALYMDYASKNEEKIDKDKFEQVYLIEDIIKISREVRELQNNSPEYQKNKQQKGNLLNYIDSLLDEYNYKFNISTSDFKKLNPAVVQKLHLKTSSTLGDSYKSQPYYKDTKTIELGPDLYSVRDDKVVSLNIVLAAGKETEMIEKTYRDILNRVKIFGSEYVTEVNEYGTQVIYIKHPDTMGWVGVQLWNEYYGKKTARLCLFFTTMKSKE